MSLLGRRTLMRATVQEEAYDVSRIEAISGTFVIEDDINFTDYGTWDNIPVARVGITNIPWEKYVVILIRLGEEAPTNDSTVGSFIADDTSKCGNFDVRNVSNVGYYQSVNGLLSKYSPHSVKIIDGVFYVQRYNQSCVFNKGDEYQFFIMERTWD